jgi:16S rRNA (cytosine967-C5)-methyltransferase
VARGRSLEGELGRLRRGVAAERTAAAEELLRGAIQWQARYDHLIRHFSTRQPPRDPVVRGVLQLALHQLLTSRGVPGYAAVHQAGELARAAGRARAVGYVNAVLQSVQRHVEAAAAADPLAAVHDLFVDPAGDPASYLAAWWSHPAWLVERWLERFGDADTARLLEHANTPAPITLHVLPGHDPAAARRRLADAGVAAEPVEGYPRALSLAQRLDRSELGRLLAEEPALLVQDAGAQAALDWLTRAGADLAGAEGPVIDLCAAPGGKAAHLRALLPAAEILVAMDLRPRRLGRLRENRERLGLLRLPLLAGDGRRPPLRDASCAAVLLDGPCSGTGVGRHHPEGRWRLRPATLERNGERLRELAGAAADLLRPGGRELAPDPDPDGRHERTWLPWRTGTDGFYAARLRRQP